MPRPSTKTKIDREGSAYDQAVQTNHCWHDSIPVVGTRAMYVQTAFITLLSDARPMESSPYARVSGGNPRGSECLPSAEIKSERIAAGVWDWLCVALRCDASSD